MTAMKRIIHTAIFLAVLAMLLAALSRIFVPKDNTREAGMEEFFANGILGEPEDTIDVLIMGDSYSSTAIIPPELWREKGITSFLIGTNDQSLSYGLEMLRRSLRTQHPRVVVLETDPVFRQMSAFERLTGILEPAFPILRYHDRWKSLRKEDFTQTPSYTTVRKFKGYQYFTKIVPAQKENDLTPTDSAERVPAPNREYVRKIRNVCEQTGAQLILFTAPNSMYWTYERHNGVQALADALGCAYLDMNLLQDEIAIDWSHDTCDGGDHLNHAGSVKASLYLADYLDRQGVLPDHRNEKGYKGWKKSLKLYERQEEKENI